VAGALRGFASKTYYILKEEGPFTYLDRTRRALTVRAKRALRDNSANISKWQRLKDAYRGQRVFLVGNGPSLNRTPLHLLKNEYTICFNRFNLMFERLGWVPTMYAVVDDRVAQDMASEINEVVPLVRHAFFPDLHPYNIDLTRVINDAANVYWLYLDRLSYCLDLPYCSIGKTVANASLQILAFLGFSDIYLIGVDMDYGGQESAIRVSARDSTGTADDDSNHFDPRYFGKGRAFHHPRMEETLEKYREAKAFFDRHGYRIYNAGVGGKLEVFPRVGFRGLFEVSRQEELNLFAAAMGVSPRGGELEATFPDAMVLNSEADWDEKADIAIVPLGPAIRLIPKVVFTHVPYGPFEERYVFRRRPSY
jgi:hypothetical protein